MVAKRVHYVRVSHPAWYPSHSRGGKGRMTTSSPFPLLWSDSGQQRQASYSLHSGSRAAWQRRRRRQLRQLERHSGVVTGQRDAPSGHKEALRTVVAGQQDFGEHAWTAGGAARTTSAGRSAASAHSTGQDVINKDVTQRRSRKPDVRAAVGAAAARDPQVSGGGAGATTSQINK